MNDSYLINMMLPIISGLMATLILIIGWIGNRLHTRLDDINKTLGKIEHDLRQDLSSLDRRVTMIEANCRYRGHMSSIRSYEEDG
jgi:hypothetical protein